MTDDELIAECEERGLAVVRPRNPDETLKNIWGQVHSLLRMMTDMVDDGAKLTLTHPSYFAATCDYKLLTRMAFMGRLDHILNHAVVIREERDDAAA